MENNKSRKHESSKGLKEGQHPEGCPSSSRLLRNGAEVERIMELVESNWKWEGKEYENNALAESPKLDSIGEVYLTPLATDAEIRAYWIGRISLAQAQQNYRDFVQKGKKDYNSLLKIQNAFPAIPDWQWRLVGKLLGIRPIAKPVWREYRAI